MMKPNPEDPKYWKNERHFKTLEYIEALEKYITDWTTPPKDFEHKKIKISSNVNKKRYEVIKTTFSDFKQVSLGDNKTNKVIAHFVNQDEDTMALVEKITDILNLKEN